MVTCGKNANESLRRGYNGERRLKMPKDFKYRKYMGDDMYSYAVFHKRGGSPIVTGCDRRDAKYRAEQLQREKDAKENTQHE